jgi:type 1 fimbria pilin
MKKTLLSTVPFLALCALTASMAQAATTTDLTLTGQILPNACDISVANGGVLALGDIPFASLNATGMTDVTPAANKLTTIITCTNATLIAFTTTDNRTASSESFPAPNGSLPQNYKYGLGMVNGQPIGGTIFRAAGSPTVDGSAAELLYITSSGVIGAPPAFSRLADLKFTLGTPGNDTALAGRTFVFDITATIAITDRKNLPTNQPVVIDGSTTLELVYL